MIAKLRSRFEKKIVNEKLIVFIEKMRWVYLSILPIFFQHQEVS